jgi:MFS family permease
MPQRALRRLSLLAAVALSLEAALYSAVAPLLPHYRDELGLSKTAAGVLTASYTAGMVIGSLLGAVGSSRFGPKRTVVIGLIVLGVASVAFGFSGSVELLDGTRALQGLGAGIVWSGMLAWLIAAAPEGRRGQVLGSAMGAAIFGTLFGPVLGTLGVAVGPQVAFSFTALMTGAVGVAVVRAPAPTRDPDLRSDWRRARRNGQLIGLTLLSLLPGITAGVINAVIPLRLDAGGVSEVAIGAVFLVGALVAALASPVAGRQSDRVGRVPLVVVGLGLGAPVLIALGLVNAPWVVAALVVVAFGCVVTLFSVPLMALLSQVAEAAGLTAGPAAALLNLTFAMGETIGAPSGAGLADATGDGMPFVVLGVVAGTAALLVAARVREPAGSAPAVERA